MANKNIEINYNTGNGYDVLYPKVILSNSSGTLSISQGGTGKTTTSAALGNLIWNGGTVNSLSSNYKIAIATGANIGGGYSLGNFISYIQSNLSGGCAIEVVEFLSTGGSKEVVFPSHGNLRIRFFYLVVQGGETLEGSKAYFETVSAPTKINVEAYSRQVRVDISSSTTNKNIDIVGAISGSLINNNTYEIPKSWNVAGNTYRAVAIFG